MLSRLLLICATSALMACSPASESVDESQADLIVDGSSTVYPIMAQAARLYATATPNSLVAVNFSGTSGGFRRFCDGEIQISAASREINA
jgi:phosphate transport system substrate-binding protein